MARRQADLLFLIACSLALVAVILAVPFAAAARIALGLPFVLLFPGYALTAALFPGRGEPGPVERAVLSLALSVGVVSLIALALNFSSWGISLRATLAFVTLAIILAAAVAALRRWLANGDSSLSAATNARRPLSWPHVAGRVGAPAMALALLAAAGYLAAGSASDSESSTEFYILGPAGRAEGYPSDLRAGESATIILGVANREGEDASYRIEVRARGRQPGRTLALRLADGQRWEDAIAFPASAPGDSQRVDFLLYKDGGALPYRSLYLRLDVEGAVVRSTPLPTPAAAAGAALAVENAPAPAEEPPSAEEPQYRVHTVVRGENLTVIAARYGVPLEDVIAANTLRDPDLIYPRQEIRIPSGGGAGESE